LGSESKSYIHPSAFVDEGCKIGEGTKIWHFCHISAGAVIGNNCNLGQNVMVAAGVLLGNNVKVQNNVSIYEGVVCEDYVFLGPSMVFTNITNPRSAIVRKGQYAKTIVRKGVTIGANATIVCGHELGEFSFIGAGAVVTKSVKQYALMVGNPARQIGWMSEFGHRLSFNANGIAICPESKEKYKLENAQVHKLISS
jgi:UDP-2-acetamido-3-amino-2,3-dideoxy-glucuronate N-acetyltransferase